MSYKEGGENKKIISALNKVLADTFQLYFKTHSFHWNVEGRRFKTLHELFGEQYTELWAATDELAERIRSLGAYAPNSWSEMIKNASLSEVGQIPEATDMVKQLASDHDDIVSEALYPALKAAEDAGDQVTVDMMVARIAVHEKTAWMLKSTAKG